MSGFRNRKDMDLDDDKRYFTVYVTTVVEYAVAADDDDDAMAKAKLMVANGETEADDIVEIDTEITADCHGLRTTGMDE